MPLSQLLFSFSGRINRKPWWLTNLAIGVIVFVVMVAVMMMAGGALLSQDPAAMVGALGGVAIVLVIVIIPLIWIWLALGAKRLHDRNKSAWWLLILWVLPLVLQYIGGMIDSVGFIFGLAGFAISIWAIVELGFLRGTVGPNQYGPDPLEGRL